MACWDVEGAAGADGEGEFGYWVGGAGRVGDVGVEGTGDVEGAAWGGLVGRLRRWFGGHGCGWKWFWPVSLIAEVSVGSIMYVLLLGRGSRSFAI